MNRDLYEVLGIDKTADDEEIKKAYRQKSKETHPDTGGNDEMFYLVKVAGEVLRDHTRKKLYDETGAYEEGIPEQEDQKTEKLLAQAFFQVYSQFQISEIEYIDFIAVTVDQLYQDIKEKEDSIGQYEKNIAAYKIVLKRLTHKYKDKSNGFLIRSIESNLIQLKNELNLVKKEIKEIEQAIELAAEYEFDYRRAPTEIAQVHMRPRPTLFQRSES